MTEPARPWWSRLRLSIRGLMILVLVIGAPLGWYLGRVASQRAAVRAVTESGGRVQYDFEDHTWLMNPPQPGAPSWLVKLLGVDFFADVVSVKVGPNATEDLLPKLARLRRLKTIDARKMLVSDAGLASIAGLTDLQGISFKATSRLTDAGLAHLSGMKQLGSLWIEGSPGIKGPGLAHLAGLGQLRFLVISSETSAGLENLARLGQLRWLALELGDVTEEAMTKVSKLTQVDNLSFGGEKGNDAHMGKLRGMKNLTHLTVWGPWFSDSGLTPIVEMGYLTHFGVSDTTSVTPEGLTNLQRKLPELKIGVNGTGEVPKARTNLLRSAVGTQAIGSR